MKRAIALLKNRDMPFYCSLVLLILLSPLIPRAIEDGRLLLTALAIYLHGFAYFAIGGEPSATAVSALTMISYLIIFSAVWLVARVPLTLMAAPNWVRHLLLVLWLATYLSLSFVCPFLDSP